MNQSPTNHDEDLQKAERVAYLIAGHIRETLTPEERTELDDWVTESDENLELFEKLTDEDNIEMGIQKYLQKEKSKSKAFADVEDKIRKENKFKIWPYIVAVSFILAAISFYIFRVPPKNNYTEKPIAKNKLPNDIAPGENKAVLTLSNGRTIILDSSVSSTLANEGEVNISQKNGELLYSGKSNEVKPNMISVPRGGQYTITLSDGTKVWLNSESSLKYPASFNGATRQIELTGEGYFEVAKDATKPFIVSTTSKNGTNQKVTVLGTYFNINAYEDEGKIYTTLVEGSVKIEVNGMTKILKPGEKAVSAKEIEVVTADVNETIAWKEGKFVFHDATIQSIGEQIKRWYDVDVEYQGKVTQFFNTEVPRNVPLSKLLNGLEGTGQVEFKLENKKLIIKP